MDTKHHEKIKNLYAQWAPSYDRSFSGAEKSAAVIVEESKLIDLVDPKPTEFILDVGCGTGRVTQELFMKTKHVKGVDISEEMLDLARSKLPTVEFVTANLEEGLPFGDETFDKVVSSLVFQFLKDVDTPFNEIYRVLKPSGKAYITTFVSDGTLDWGDIEYKNERPKTIPSGAVGEASVFRPLNDFINTAKQADFSSVEYQPLPLEESAKEILTDSSYRKVLGKWASVVLLLVK